MKRTKATSTPQASYGFAWKATMPSRLAGNVILRSDPSDHSQIGAGPSLEVSSLLKKIAWVVMGSDNMTYSNPFEAQRSVMSVVWLCERATMFCRLVSADAQSVPAKVEIEGLKMYHLFGAKTAPVDRPRAVGLGHGQRPQSESSRSDPQFT